MTKNTFKTYTLSLFLILFLSACNSESGVKTSPPESDNPDITAQHEVFHWEKLHIVNQDGEKHRFKVQIADSKYEMGLGFMFRQSIPTETGMLFQFKQPVLTKFWMHNVYLPLDVLFLDQNGKIIYIEKAAQPGDTTPFGPDVPFLGVLEINGDLAEVLNIQVGDVVKHPFFKAK